MDAKIAPHRYIKAEPGREMFDAQKKQWNGIEMGVDAIHESRKSGVHDTRKDGGRYFARARSAEPW